MITGKFAPGDWVIYRKTKHSVHPGPRASNVAPARFGDGYSYTVDKFWVVQEVRPDGTVLLQTRRGKQHTVRADDPCLRKAGFFQRWIYRSRFEAVSETPPAASPGGCASTLTTSAKAH